MAHKVSPTPPAFFPPKPKRELTITLPGCGPPEKPRDPFLSASLWLTPSCNRHLSSRVLDASALFPRFSSSETESSFAADRFELAGRSAAQAAALGVGVVGVVGGAVAVSTVHGAGAWFPLACGVLSAGCCVAILIGSKFFTRSALAVTLLAHAVTSVSWQSRFAALFSRVLLSRVPPCAPRPLPACSRILAWHSWPPLPLRAPWGSPPAMNDYKV